MALLTSAPPVQLRRETVEVPEWGGEVVVRGLSASEAFAIQAIRQQAMRRVLEEQRAAREQEQPAPEVSMTFSEWRDYAAYVPQLLARTVTGDGGLGLYSAEDWEAVSQHFPGVMQRLQAVAERLSGLNAEDVGKNSPSSQA